MSNKWLELPYGVTIVVILKEVDDLVIGHNFFILIVVDG
jgi:hypothetical protein